MVITLTSGQCSEVNVVTACLILHKALIYTVYVRVNSLIIDEYSSVDIIVLSDINTILVPIEGLVGPSNSALLYEVCLIQTIQSMYVFVLQTKNRGHTTITCARNTHNH